MDRASSKHGPRVDDQLAGETQAYRRGAPVDGRADEWREPEPTADGEPNVSAVPQADERSISQPAPAMTPEDIEGRSEVGRFLARSVFPADRDALVAAAQAADAPDHVVATLAKLPAGVEYPTVARAWAALGHPLDPRF